MKNFIAEQLKTKFEGVSADIIGRIADKVAKTATTKEDAETALQAVTFQSVLEQYGDSRATEASLSAVRNYEKKHGLKDGKAVEQARPSEPAPTVSTPAENKASASADVPEWAKAIMEQNRKMAERIGLMEREKLGEGRKQSIAELIQDLPASVKKAYERIPLDTMTDDDFTALSAEIKSEAEAIGNDLKSRGAIFGKPNSGTAIDTTREATEAEVKAVVDRLNI